jgi:1,4-alpha-glucan branching enzyme
LGANKFRHPDGSLRARFAVWAPNAQSVEVVIGKIWDRNDPQQAAATSSLPSADIAGGYIADDGTGRDPAYAPFTLSRSGDGTWQSDIDDPRLRDFRQLDHKPYMYRVVRDDGSIAYRTDLYSRCQIGYGAIKPRGQPYEGLLADLDGTGSCSVIVDPEMVTRDFREDLSEPPGAPGAVVVWPERYFVTDTEFWADEFGRSLPPSKIEDLIIYELHTGALGFGSPKPGTIADAIALLDHLLDVGVNTVELLPLSEFGGGGENWGYATSHYFAIEYSGGGRDQYKFFVKEAHKRGIAVIMDVVYNHYSHDAERAQWMYDTARHDSNAYYWYEGTPSQYSEPEGGYLDNMSTAHAPRYHEEMVRKLFIGSAAALIAEFHIESTRRRPSIPITASTRTDVK